MRATTSDSVRRPGEAHDLDVGVGPRQLLAHERVVGDAAPPHLVDDAPELLLYCTCWVVALPPRSLPSVVIVTRQPLCRPPITLNSGARASVMNVSVKLLLPVVWRIGRSSKPFDEPSGRFIGGST